MRAVMMGVAGVVVLVFSAVPADADIVELDLFTLSCPTTHDHNSGFWTSDFDLGVTFSQIDHVYMDWSGEITGELVVHQDDPCNPFALDTAINSYLDMPVHALSSMWGGQATYPDPQAFDGQSDFTLWGSWSGLLDGQGTVWVYYTGPIHTPETHILKYGTVTLDSATLVVDGVVVPEPYTLLFLALGGFWVTCKRKSHSHATPIL